MNEIKNIALSEIEPSPLNPRKTFEDAPLQSLAANIKAQGLLQPITIRPKDGHYEIVCGERRYRAVKVLGLETIPALVRDLNDADAYDAMITENLNREDVSPVEEAFAFARLKERGDDVKDIAARFGRSVRFVQDRMHLNDLVAPLMLKLRDGVLPIGGAMQLAKLDKESQEAFAEEIADEKETIAAYRIDGYINKRFRYLARKPWADDFKGPCGVECSKCSANTINAGCLFYEMRTTEDNARCTQGGRFAAKNEAWWQHIVDSYKTDLVKKGEGLEVGKTIIVYNVNYGQLQGAAKAFVERLGKTYEVAEANELFSGWSKYNEDDERLKEKLKDGKAMRCLRIVADWQGSFEMYDDFGEVRPPQEGSQKDAAEAMGIVAKKNDLVRKSDADLSAACGEMLRDHVLGDAPLTENERLVALACIIAQDWQRRADCLTLATKNVNNQANYIRAFISSYLSGQRDGDLYEAQLLIAQEWEPKKFKAAYAESVEKLEKKTGKLKERLAALGYDEEGKRL